MNSNFHRICSHIVWANCSYPYVCAYGCCLMSTQQTRCDMYVFFVLFAGRSHNYYIELPRTNWDPIIKALDHSTQSRWRAFFNIIFICVRASVMALVEKEHSWTQHIKLFCPKHWKEFKNLIKVTLDLAHYIFVLKNHSEYSIWNRSACLLLVFSPLQHSFIYFSSGDIRIGNEGAFHSSRHHSRMETY